MQRIILSGGTSILTVEKCKKELRLMEDETYEDDLIGENIEVAEEMLKDFTGQTFRNQIVQYKLYDAVYEFLIVDSPLISIDSCTVTNNDDSTFDPTYSQSIVDGRVLLSFDDYDRTEFSELNITVTVGYNASSIPAKALKVMKSLVVQMHLDRENPPSAHWQNLIDNLRLPFIEYE
ncbi:hypothetical protein [Flammeovirga sp. OC4]|uniref:hypothetical protein n=1 Tax=Flammeovirga sp. OC4 TaxID=1382345 RepID=UPI0005C63087|nr:hypothetical protein [Flammeovirga sp. OC4]